MYKLAVLDIDNTILMKDRPLSGELLSTVAALGARDIPVCISTGRNLASSLHIARALGINTHLVTIDGTTIYSMAENKTVYANCPSPETFRRAIDIVDYDGRIVAVCTDDEFIFYSKEIDACDAILSRDKTELEWKLFEKEWSVVKTGDINKAYAALERAREISFRSLNEAELLNIKETLERADFASELTIRLLWDDMLLVGASGISKADGLRKLCELYGISPEETVAIGDERNDIPMLKLAGMGVAMGNALPEVKEAADYVTDTVNNDGVVLALRKFFG
jgi:Cof subfamily protein (haloacid dehalogenase superfamily)